MAISSPLNPATIARERPTTAAAAQNFITGGSPLGEGVVASAANKIVGFQRGAAAGVAARPPDLNGIIQTLSTSILSNVENRVQSVNQNVTQIVNKTISGLQTDYKERLDKIDAARPNTILQNFLNLYKQALGYIQFLGNRKNVKTLGENLKSLQNVFTETFNVAKIIRQTIIKIVKQLSNLPASTAGGGGLNLDIDIPGGGLKKGPMGGLSRMMRRRPGMMLGGAALAGGLGSQVVSGMMDVGGEVQAASVSEGTIPTSLLDRFNGVLDRFSAAINSLSKVKKTTSSSSGGKEPAPTPSPDPKPGAPGAPGAVSSAPGDEKLAAFVATMEAGSPENAADAMQVMLNRSASGKYGKGLSGVLSGYDQFSPISAAIFGKSKDEHAQAKYGPIAAKLPGNTPQEKFKYLQQVASEPDGLNKLQQLFGGGNSGVAATILNDSKYLESSRQNVKGALNFYGGKKKNASDIQVRSGGNNFYNFTGPIGTLGKQPTGTSTTAPPKPSTVAAAPNQSQAQQQAAQAVAQAPAQQKSQITVAPMNMSSPQTQSTGQGGKSIPPPQMAVGGVSVPFFSSSNTDNFLTLYSKIVYNIVDG